MKMSKHEIIVKDQGYICTLFMYCLTRCIAEARLTFCAVVRCGEVLVHHQSTVLWHTLIANLDLLYPADQRPLPLLLLIKQQGPAPAHGRVGQLRQMS